ncbi:MAG TPA: flavin reductase family protein [Alphaproteobacteria bacterium]|nr:flavin reductase family protein [Alphaproteobacteria bacterium]
MLRESFIDGMRLAATGVSIITTKTAEGRRAGVTVSAVCSVSADPPSLLACLHHQSRAADAIIASGAFCVNILSEDQEAISEVFAGRLPIEGGDHFAAAEWMPLATGSPALVGALAAFDCTLVRHLRWGSHHVLIGTVCDVELGEGRPLVYCDRNYSRLALEGSPLSAA